MRKPSDGSVNSGKVIDAAFHHTTFGRNDSEYLNWSIDFDFPSIDSDELV